MRSDRKRRHEVGLIGSGIRDSLSPALHEREAALLGLEYSYALFDIDELGRAPEDAGRLAREALGRDLAGLNVTHPCKQRIVPALDDLSAEAEALGAVNTVVFDGNRMVGHNTDASGFREAFERRLPAAATTSVVLLGAGGAGAAVGYAALSLGARRLTVLDADPKRAQELVDRLGERATVGDMQALGDLLAAADGLIHATPTGMVAYPGTAVPAEMLQRRLWVAEVVYVPIETALLRDARAMGCRTLNGAAMVALQAAGSMELFTGLSPDRDRMLQHVDELTTDRREAA